MDNTSCSCMPFGIWRSLPMLSRAGAAIEDDKGDIKAKAETMIVV